VFPHRTMHVRVCAHTYDAGCTYILKFNSVTAINLRLKHICSAYLYVHTLHSLLELVLTDNDGVRVLANQSMTQAPIHSAYIYIYVHTSTFSVGTGIDRE